MLLLHAKKKGEDEIGFDLYIRMELLHPIASGRKIKSEFETDEVIKLGIDICNALEECHSKNIFVFCKCKFPKFADKNGEYCISVLEKVADCPAGLPDAS